MFAHDIEKENAYQFSRFNRDHLLSTCSVHPLELEDERWMTAEHYYQAQIVASKEIVEKIKNAESGEQAYKLGSRWFRRKKAGWKDTRRVFMTRALYTKVQMYPLVKEALLDTDERLILETSLYDPYWGISRDQRGENMLGKVWMDIRKKLVELKK
ncbi:hypothetical protein SAMN02745866_01517 [Alteromonadaceae bacterium Bs31]|nr:hypothetical protein SAMN02745866_01517 [Alteromonadaceae bacterium Bs31]